MATLYKAFGLGVIVAMQASCTLPDKPQQVSVAAPALPSVETLSATEMERLLANGQTSSEALTKASLERMSKIDKAGPTINAVIATFPDALDQARARDNERGKGIVNGPLHGVPILLKDNIEAAGPVATTAGSFALKDNITNRDAPLVKRLRDAGAVILGKTNLSEWANIRSSKSTSGWSFVGGLTLNPHALDHNACGSSSGSGAAVAAGLVPLAIGTETDGSIVCPSSVNGIVGLKPTVGLVSRRYIVPISHSQDTAGPMARSVRDAAMLLTVIAGSDPDDPATIEADAHKMDYVQGLDTRGLKGLRIGVLRDSRGAATLFNAAMKRLEQGGATLVDVTVDTEQSKELGEAEFLVLLTEFKANIASYLNGRPKGPISYRSLTDLIAFNNAHANTEMAYFTQDIFEAANETKGLRDPEYLAAREKSFRLAGPEGIDQMLAENKVDLLVAQTNGPAWVTTLGKGDAFIQPSASTLPAVAGYPHLTVPMGAVDGLPIGLSFIGPKWSEALLLRAGYAFEQGGPSLMVRPNFKP